MCTTNSFGNLTVHTSLLKFFLQFKKAKNTPARATHLVVWQLCFNKQPTNKLSKLSFLEGWAVVYKLINE